MFPRARATGKRVRFRHRRISGELWVRRLQGVGSVWKVGYQCAVP